MDETRNPTGADIRVAADPAFRIGIGICVAAALIVLGVGLTLTH